MTIALLSRTTLVRLLVLLSLLFVSLAPVYCQAGDPEAYLRFEEPSAGVRHYYVAVYMKTALTGGMDEIKTSLRDVGGKKKLLSTTVESPPVGDNSTFIMRVALSESDVFKQHNDFKVLVDSYPTAQGIEDYEIGVKLDVKVEVVTSARCFQRNSILVTQVSTTQYGQTRFNQVSTFLGQANAAQQISATVTKDPKSPQPRTVSPLTNSHNPKSLSSCIDFTEAPPPGEYTFKLSFNNASPPELQFPPLEGGGTGPDIPNPTAEKRDVEDFFDLGLSLTSSVEDQEQPNGTTKRIRTTRGTTDLFLAPILNLRKVGTLPKGGGTVQVFTPFYIDSRVSTGKITKDTLSLNRVELGSTYEFRHYLNTNAYPDLMRHALSFKHNSDRDFKQDEFTFTYEFQPIFGAINQPLGSAPDILHDEIVPNEKDKFGLQIVPILGVEIGRTYRVRNPSDFAGVSRNVRRFYFGADLTFDLTKYVQLSVKDLFYIRGENPLDRKENYFVASIEAPLSRIGNLRAAHALFFSFEKGEEAPFSNPAVNVLKFGYRIRERGLLFNPRTK